MLRPVVDSSKSYARNEDYLSSSQLVSCTPRHVSCIAESNLPSYVEAPATEASPRTALVASRRSAAIAALDWHVVLRCWHSLARLHSAPRNRGLHRTLPLPSPYILPPVAFPRGRCSHDPWISSRPCESRRRISVTLACAHHLLLLYLLHASFVSSHHSHLLSLQWALTYPSLAGDDHDHECLQRLVALPSSVFLHCRLVVRTP